MSKTTKYLIVVFFLFFILLNAYVYFTYFKNRTPRLTNQPVQLIPPPAGFDAKAVGSFKVATNEINATPAENLTFVGNLKKVLSAGGTVYANVLLSNNNVQTVILSEKTNAAGGALTFIKAKTAGTLQFDQIEAEMNKYLNKNLTMSLIINDCNKKLLEILQTKKNAQLTCLPRIEQVETE